MRHAAAAISACIALTACAGNAAPKRSTSSGPPHRLGPGTAPKRDANHNILPGSGLVGTWTGTVDQHGPGGRSSSFPLVVKIHGQSTAHGVGQAIYPDGCRTDLSILDAGPSEFGFGYGYRLSETSLTDCRSDPLEDTVSVLGDELTWIWDRHPQYVVGTLHRTGAPQVKPAQVFASLRAAVAGRWTGTATQFGPGAQSSRFTVVLGLASLVGQLKPGWYGFVRYPSDHCQAQLFYDQPVGDSLRYDEQVVGGDCVRGGRIDIRPFGKVLLFRWHGQYHHYPIDSWALLRRTNNHAQADEEVAREGG